LTRRWVLQRYFRTGNTWGRVGLALAESESAAKRRTVRLRLAGRAAFNLLRGVELYLRGVLTFRLPLRARGACRAVSACGALAACSGHVYGEYSRDSAAGWRSRIMRNASTT
jgi:hypothetical protein